jgi:hypothetical protein
LHVDDRNVAENGALVFDCASANYLGEPVVDRSEFGGCTRSVPVHLVDLDCLGTPSGFPTECIGDSAYAAEVVCNLPLDET